MLDNKDFSSMLAIMDEIGFTRCVNGVQASELYGLAWYKLHYRESAIYLDVGTNFGNSSIIMASAIKHQNVNIPSKVFTVDDYSESKNPELDIETTKKNFSYFGISDLISFHVGNDIDYINSLPDNYIDMVFDDSSHTYKDTLNRLRAYIPKMNSNSLIVGHDYYVNFPGIVKAVHEFKEEFKDILCGWGSISGMFWMFCKVEVE